MLRALANGWNPRSLAGRFRRKRFELLLRILSECPSPVRILDVGGLDRFWLVMDLERMPPYEITFLNLYEAGSELPHSRCLVGDGRDMKEFADGEFDLVVSNSVIEHVGNLREQKRFAREIQRVGKRYFVQTPNRRFVMEPHFLLPLFQYYPLPARAFLHQHFNLGWWKRAGDYLDALEEVESIRLLRESELRRLFPDGKIHREYCGPWIKSFVAHR
jgi:hypothetical protein